MTGDQFLPCSFCGAASPHSALATFGARCKPCFDAYCLERPKPVADPQGRRPEWQTRKAKAATLRADEAATTAPPRVELPPIARSDSFETDAIAIGDPPAWATEEAE